MHSRRSWILTGALLAVSTGSLLLLWPVLFSPVAADDRYWFVENPVRTDLSMIEAVRYSFRETPTWLNLGRIAPLAFLARRVMLLATFKFSVATSTPIYVSQGLGKLFLLCLGLAACLAFVKSLRWRTESGVLVGMARRQILLIGVAMVPLVAAGSQAHTQFRNGWISYPVLTYGALTVVFSAAALVAWCTRRVAERRRGAVVVAVISMALLGIALTTSYELYYVAFPLSIAVLFIFPYSPEKGDLDARRARIIVGGTLTLVFMSFLLGIRRLIAEACATGDCYVGTNVSFGPKLGATLWNNFFSSIPGSSHTRFLAELEELGQSARWPDSATPALVIVATLVVGGVVAAWMTLAKGAQSNSEVTAQRRLLLAVSGVAGLVGVGGALIMSVSTQAQDVIESVGFPYRHTVLTWVSISLAIVSLAFAAAMSSWRHASWVAPVILVGLTFAAASFSLPRNLVSNQVYRVIPANQAIEDIHWEVIAGDRSDLGDARRCETLERAEESITNPWLTNRLVPAADAVFRRLNNLPYCSTWSGT